MKLKRILIKPCVLLIVFFGFISDNYIDAKSYPEITEVRGLFFQDGAPVSVTISNGMVKEIVRIDESELDSQKKVYISPGLIDNQVNGFMSHGFTHSGLTVEKIRTATEGLWETGVTTYLPTVVTASQERLLENFRILAKATHEKDIGPSLPGFHLEGPYINSESGFRGAHNPKWIRKPDMAEFEEMYKAAEYKILQVSLAPEQEGAIEFIRMLSEKGIIVALAHHNGTAEDITKAADAGADVSTHLGNGCANMIHRHDNPLWPQLAEDRLMASIIVDGFHLRPEEVKTFYSAKGKERILLTSDVTHLAGMPPGEYTWDDKRVVLEPEGVIKLPAQDVLAGAAAPIKQSVENVMKYTGCSLRDAIDMATKNPARLNNLHDRGTLETGKRADIILFTLEDGLIQIQKTILMGKVVYEAK